MGEIILLSVLAFLSVITIGISYVIKTDENHDGKNMFLFGMFILIISVLAIGVLMGKNEVKKVKHKVEPVIKTECMNTKCDTTYIYTFKED
jgi:hypothetical protein